MKTDEAFLKAQIQVLLLKMMKHKTYVLGALLQYVNVDTKIVEVDYLCKKSRKHLFITR
jgi:hypothetical protein